MLRYDARVRVASVFLWPLLAFACGGSTVVTSPPADDAGVVDASANDAAPPIDSGVDDGTPSTTAACTPLSKQTGTIVTSVFGRLDGTLAYVVPRGGSAACNGDDSHVHLQILVLGNVYDVAVDIGKFAGDVLEYEAEMPLPDGAWSEGWHGTDSLAYPTQLGLHANQFTPQDPATLGAALLTALAGKNHISIFGSGYPTANGCHDVHYRGTGPEDGAIFIDPLSPNAHGFFFRFSTQSF